LGSLIKTMNATNEDHLELDPVEEAILINEISDEALEAAAISTVDKITFTFSIHPMYCRFC
jgi:hypothetical protein